MRINSILAAGAAAALLMTPAAAFAGDKKPPKTNTQAKAYGKRCQGLSKKHVKGQKGTPFSQCVVAMAQLASGKATSPKAACKKLSKKHVKGKKGTPFSRCVKAGRKLEAEHDGETYSDPFDKD